MRLPQRMIDFQNGERAEGKSARDCFFVPERGGREKRVKLAARREVAQEKENTEDQYDFAPPV